MKYFPVYFIPLLLKLFHKNKIYCHKLYQCIIYHYAHTLLQLFAPRVNLSQPLMVLEMRGNLRSWFPKQTQGESVQKLHPGKIPSLQLNHAVRGQGYRVHYMPPISDCHFYFLKTFRVKFLFNSDHTLYVT